MTGTTSPTIFPGQIALAQFGFGQNALANAQSFGKAGMGHGTGQTMADAGAYMKEALDINNASLADTAAQANFNNQQKSQISNLIGSAGSSFTSGGSLAA